MKIKKRKTGIEIPKLESFVPMPSIKPAKETEIKDLYSHIDDMIIKDLEAKYIIVFVLKHRIWG